ncbi:MAG TPA: wax ester/triacylglycerol synthase family O-acyltransferase [Steroidobacteraceae bacterium]|nr:wax ester/triacylglycerol synthase family O-acyltransferase [Steroidobacteraceae bacterium]
MQPLSALDALFLHLETDETPMHVGVLHVMQPPETGSRRFVDTVRDHIAARMSSASVLTRRLRELPLGIANPVWEAAERIDLEFHIRSSRLPRPGSHAQLVEAVAARHAERLDLARPLWEFHLFEGLASGQLALYTKVHHAALDGAAAVALAHALLDPTPVPRELPEKKQRPVARAGLAALLGASLRSNAGQAARIAGRLPAAARALVTLVQSQAPNVRLAPRTPLNVAIDARRSVATASVPLASVRRVAAAHEVTINDVVLALVSGAVRRHLERLDVLPEQSLIGAMPVSLRARGDDRPTTLATMTLTELATDIADPLARLKAIHGHARGAKHLAQRLEGVMPTDFPSLGLPWLLTAAAQLYGRSRLADRVPPVANLVVSNVPGPEMPLYLAGARLESWWPLSIVEHGLGLNVTVESYAGSLDFGLVAATRAVADLEPLAGALSESLRELEAPSRKTRARTPRSTPRPKK